MINAAFIQPHNDRATQGEDKTWSGCDRQNMVTLRILSSNTQLND